MQINDANAQVYTYDKIYQLTEVDYNEPNKTWYYYDKLGNRTKVSENTTDTTYDSNALNQYVTVGGTSYEYDKNGNLISDGVHTYQYEYENRLISVDNGSTATYKYDFAGRRISKTVGATTTTYLYDGDQIIGDYVGTQYYKRYYYGSGIDEPICMEKWPPGGTTGVYYYYYDGLGNVAALGWYNGQLKEKYSYDVYGKPTIREPNDAIRATSQFGNRYMFTGREYDAATGLYYYRARYYKPSLGQFMQTDPIGYPGGLNLYTYVGNNPLNWTDHWGLCKDPNSEITLPSGEIIPKPADVSVFQNANMASKMSAKEFYNHVKSGGEWDYKIRDRKYEKFGNFNYGVTGRANGWSERRLLREGGRASWNPITRRYSGPGYPGWIFNPWGGVEPYGDTWEDNWYIKQGFDWYDDNIGK
jgi:RHS repeat-associated protein